MENTWIQEVLDAFTALNREVHVQEIYSYIRKNSKRKLSSTWEASVRKNIEHYSSDSEAFLGKADLFQSVRGIGLGIWKLRELQSPSAPDSTTTYNAPPRSETKVSRIIRDTKIGRTLKKLYLNRCQVCGQALKYHGGEYSEAHHLMPLGKHGGPDVVENLLILCPNHHAEFDLGAIAIDPTGRITHIDKLNKYDGKKLRQLHHIENRFTVYHFGKIFKGRR